MADRNNQLSLLDAFHLREDIEIHCHELIAKIDALDRLLQDPSLSNQERQNLVFRRATLVKSFYKDKQSMRLLSAVTGAPQ